LVLLNVASNDIFEQSGFVSFRVFSGHYLRVRQSSEGSASPWPKRATWRAKPLRP